MRGSVRLHMFCNDIGKFYKEYCNNNNAIYRMTTLERIQGLVYLLRKYLIYSKYIKYTQDIQFIFENPSPYKVLGGLDEDSDM